MKNFAWIKPVAILFAICLLVSTTSRIGLLAWQWDRVPGLHSLPFLLIQGLRFDVLTLGLLLGIPLAVTPLMLSFSTTRKRWSTILYFYAMAVVSAMLFMELATPSFINEFDVRPNLLFVEYLNHPSEVFSMLWSAYKLPLFVAAILLPLFILWTRNRLKPNFLAMPKPNTFVAVLLIPCILLVAVMSVRSTLDHRPINPSTAAFTNDPLINAMALNSTYSVLYAIYELRHEDATFAYGNIEEPDAVNQIRLSMGIEPSRFSNPNIPTLHWQESSRKFEQPKNLVIIIEESLGAEFVGSMGGLPLTPNIDRLAKEGIWFERMYATGTRSVRGLEAIITGFLPTTSGSVVKLGKSQQDFFTLGSYLKGKGYDTSFIYGGESQFDNMRRFFANNGFDTVVDEKDYENPVFFGSWGASDEDLFKRAHEYFEQVNGEKPFFSVVFTSSNHSPFEFPDGRIELYEHPKNTVNNAVKYADYALGAYFDDAKGSSYWNDTIFLMISDHNSRVYGAQLVPVERFHIPAIILGGSIEPAVINRVASQVDMLPTLLSLAGVSGKHPAVGIDLTRNNLEGIPGRAMMQFGRTQGYLEENRLIVLRKDFEPEQYVYEGGELIPQDVDNELQARALATAAWPWHTYNQKRYRLPVESKGSAAPAGSAR